MLPSNSLGPSRLYLDIDGVIIADNSPFETISLNPLESYAPEVVERLGNTGLELVLLSTWGKRASYLTERIEPLSAASIDPTYLPNTQIIHKRDALIADQLKSPAPFVWVDDMITDWARRIVAKKLSVPKLLIKPDEETGLNDSELKRIEAFAYQHQI